MTSTTVPPKATLRDWIGLAVLAVPCFVYSMDLTVLMLAVPQLSADLEPTASQLLWITDIYGFLVAGFLMIMGTLGDRIGRRRLLMIGAGAFGVASLFAAFAQTAEMLILARAVLGVAGATLAPSTLSLIRNMFLDERQRGFAIGVWIACFSAGATLGPVMGGFLLHFFWWGSVFLIALPVMAMLLIAGPRLLPESFDPNAGRADWLSALMLLASVLPVIYGIKKIAESGGDATYASCILFGAIVGALFVRRQDRLADPLIDIDLFRQPGFTPALAINIVGLFMAFGFFLLSAQYLQLVLGLSPLASALWMIPTGVMFILGSLLAPVMIRNVRRVYVIAGGFVLSALGFAIVAMTVHSYDVLLVVIGVSVFCAGLSPIGALTTDMVLTIAPPERAGAASAISETSFEFGGAVGIAVVGSVSMAIYRTVMHAEAPADTPAIAYDTLATAISHAPDLTDPAQQAQLVEAARHAFTVSVEVAAWMAVAGAVVAAVLALALLRQYKLRASL